VPACPADLRKTTEAISAELGHAQKRCGAARSYHAGAPALAAMQTAAHGARHVQLGQLAGLTLELPAPTVRSAALDIRGMACTTTIPAGSASRCSGRNARSRWRSPRSQR